MWVVLGSIVSNWQKRVVLSRVLSELTVLRLQKVSNFGIGVGSITVLIEVLDEEGKLIDLFTKGDSRQLKHKHLHSEGVVVQGCIVVKELLSSGSCKSFLVIAGSNWTLQVQVEGEFLWVRNVPVFVDHDNRVVVAISQQFLNQTRDLSFLLLNGHFFDVSKDRGHLVWVGDIHLKLADTVVSRLWSQPPNRVVRIWQQVQFELVGHQMNQSPLCVREYSLNIFVRQVMARLLQFHI